MSSDHDVVVVGAGLAGLAAARTLSESGVDVVVLEARSRVGGRTHSVLSSVTNTVIDLGAEWVSPAAHHAVVAELTHYDLTLAPAETATVDDRWILDGRRRHGGAPLEPAEQQETRELWDNLEQLAGRIAFDDPQWHRAVEDLDLPMVTYLDTTSVSGAARSITLLRAFALMGAHESDYSLTHLLHEIAGFGSVVEAFEGEACRIDGGADRIATAIASDLHDRVHFGEQVHSIETATGGVTVSSGRNLWSAEVAVVAVPVNVLRGWRLDVPLTDSARHAVAAGHAGRVRKLWASSPTAPSHSYVWPDAPESYAVGRPGAPGSVAIFGPAGPDELADHRAMITAVESLRPDAQLAPDPSTHDWIGDPHTQGTWFASRPGQAQGWYDLSASSGPCFFAGGDLSRRWVGWMDGALTSGADAAERALQYLSGEVHVTSVSG